MNSAEQQEPWNETMSGYNTAVTVVTKKTIGFTGSWNKLTESHRRIAERRLPYGITVLPATPQRALL